MGFGKVGARTSAWQRTADGKDYLLILEFDVANEKWTGRSWQYVLEQKGNSLPVMKQDKISRHGWQ